MNPCHKLRLFFRWDNPYLWAIALRVGLLALMRPHPRGDAADFQAIAHNIAAGHGFSRCWLPPFPATSQRPPLYPLILSILYRFNVTDVYGPAALNLAFDLLSMKVSEKFAKAVSLPWPRVFPWILAICPMLITMGSYPLTESLSVFLFFLATYYFFAGTPRRSGLIFGFLALCRSYYLLFPALLAATRPIKQHSRKTLIIAAIFGLAAPSIWVARNQVTLGHPLFSQTGTAGAQSYVGLCRRNFDWWDPSDAQDVLGSSPFREIFASQCMKDDELLSLNAEAWKQTGLCVHNHPGEVTINTLVKTWNLFIEWGQIFPYDYVPKSQRYLIDLLMVLLWARMIWLWAGLHRRNPDPFHYAFLNILYVVIITLPFGIDARYLLAPALLAFGLILGSLAHPIDFVREPLLRIFGEEEK
jgi:hypothetical protein